MKVNNVAIIIAVVAVVAVAGAGVFILANGNSGGGDKIEKSALPVFGNANDDSTVDTKDIDLINEIISKNGDDDPNNDIDWKNEHPFADSNRDGNVDEKDIEIVQKLIAGESTKVTFVDQYDLVKDKYRYVTLDYPLKDVVTQNADMLLLTMMIDADDKVAGYVANVEKYPNQFYKVKNNGYSQQVGTTARYIGASDWEGIKNLDVSLHAKGSEIGAILVHSDSALGDYKDDIEASGIPLVYLRCTDPIYSIDAAALLGFLLGPSYFEKASVYVEDCLKTIQSVNNKLNDIKDEDRKRFISLCMICYIGESDSQYTNIGTQAGGKEMSGLEGNTSVKLQDVEAITKYNDKIDYMLNCSTQDCVKITPDVLWEDNDVRYMEKSTHFHDMVWINMSMPVPCRVMYVASLFYPNIISHNEADIFFQKMVDKHMSYLDNTVADKDFDIRDDMFTMITYQDYLDYKDGKEPGKKVTSDILPLAVVNHFLGSMDLSGFQGYPFTSDGNDQAAVGNPTSGKYYVKATLYADAKAYYDEVKAEYEQKIGKASPMTGTYEAVTAKGNLTEGYGYYVNTQNDDPSSRIGSVYYIGYVRECVIEIHLGIKPSLSQADLDNMVAAAWGTEGTTVSARTCADNYDISLISGYRGAPFTVEGDASKAAVKNTEYTDRDYYIRYDNTVDAFLTYEANIIEFHEKIEEGNYMGGVPQPIDLNGFEKGYGFHSMARNEFYMIKFSGYKNGCYVDINIRIDNPSVDIATVNAIVAAAAASIA